MRERIFAFLNSTFSERDGTGSATRVLGGLGVAATIAWVSFIVLTTKHLPDLGGASMFVSASFSGYAVNRVARAIGKDDDLKS